MSMNIKQNVIISAYKAELKRTLGHEKVLVKLKGRRVYVVNTSRANDHGNYYTFKEIEAAIECLKKRPNFNPLIPDFLIIP
jgi:hypothetical protein